MAPRALGKAKIMGLVPEDDRIPMITAACRERGRVIRRDGDRSADQGEGGAGVVQ